MSKLIPYICCSPAPAAIDFYKAAFDAKELYRLVQPTGEIGHAELEVFGGHLYISDAFPGFGCDVPNPAGPHSVSLHLIVDDTDARTERAKALGAKIVREPRDEFYGHRSAVIVDPFGHRWMLNQVLVEMSEEDVRRKFVEAYGGATA
jgi:PhnB protein